MFSWKYKYTFNDNDTITLSPTASTWAKAFMPTLIIGAFFGLLGVVAYFADEKELETLTNDDLTVDETEQ